MISLFLTPGSADDVLSSFHNIKSLEVILIADWFRNHPPISAIVSKFDNSVGWRANEGSVAIKDGSSRILLGKILPVFRTLAGPT